LAGALIRPADARARARRSAGAALCRRRVPELVRVVLLPAGL